MSVSRLAVLGRTLHKHPALEGDWIARQLIPILTSHTELSSAAFPYLNPHAFSAFRDNIPHLLNHAGQVLEAAERVVSLIDTEEDLNKSDRASVSRAQKVVHTVLNTASVTAPTDLWLLRIVLGVFRELGLTERMLAGEVLDVENCWVRQNDEMIRLNTAELRTNMELLHARGYVRAMQGRFLLTSHPRARAVLNDIDVLEHSPSILTSLWTRLFAGEELNASEVEILSQVTRTAPVPVHDGQIGWLASSDEIELGYRIVPLVLALRVNGLTARLAAGKSLDLSHFDTEKAHLIAAGLNTLVKSGALICHADVSWSPTVIGKRVFDRAPGPFGIIEAYHPYMSRLRDSLLNGRGTVWVRRGTNVAASQDANRSTFEQTNDALDNFCESYGFEYTVFVEHAMGRGEAIRQRFARSGAEHIRYFGADLEDEAIDAALVEKEGSRQLPPNLELIRNADIGRPEVVLEYLRRLGVPSRDVVMVVGNGFHEVRDQNDEKMVAIFKAYCDAGFLLLFAEASALSVADLLETGWNTYHAGFKYVHEKSGQGLRPAYLSAAEERQVGLQASWDECATQAGYMRMDMFSKRSRTIYPFTAPDSHNPAISVNHFFIPRELAMRLGIKDH
ncbi:MAG TPA: hypothetical protein EYN06_04035 [Myxococcales bacterium]|nr:hypothetical protein [Myxococcales bacterium]